MPLNENGMVLLANTLQANLVFAQLHSSIAGDGTANIAVAGRQPVIWDTPDGVGDFGLISAINFTGGEPAGTVYSVTMWDAETPGTGIFYGEFPVIGDSTFNLSGEYQVTAIDFTGTTS